MGPAEIRTRAFQEFSKRFGRPPAFQMRPVATPPKFFDLPSTCPPSLLDQTEQICRHRFDLLGYEALDFGDPIDWHFDPVHNKRSPRTPWYQIPFLDFDQIGDHKIIWELNRHQHLVTLALARHYTNDDSFTAEIQSQWQHWQTENPYAVGINWASTLEVAFRALSWLWLRAILPDPQFRQRLLEGLAVHGWHIERYLSTYFSPNTHLLGEAVALFSIGLLCPELEPARRWQNLGWNITLTQAQSQVRPDGLHFEQSTYYHIYALDFFEHARMLAILNGNPIPAAFAATIDRMRQALAALSQAGLPPNFGDDDGGRVLLPHTPSPVPPRHPQPLSIHCMNSPDTQLFIDAGPLGALSGGHGHADALSIQLIMNGRRILIDPGTYCYTGPERDRFRGTAAHNTLQVDGRHQAQPAGPFAWTAMPATTVDRWVSGDHYDLFAGHHDGYAPVIHQRWVFGLKSRFWLVRDVVTGPDRHELAIHWHFLDQHALVILPPSGHTWSQSIDPWPWSPIYGKQEPAWVLRFSTETDLPAEFAALLVPAGPGAFTQTGPSAYRYEDDQGVHEFIFTESRFTYRGPAGTLEL